MESDSKVSALVGVAIGAAGALLLWATFRCPWFKLAPTANEIFHAIGEALIVAGVLTLSVDPLVKYRLLREASKSIFVHMIGFDHEPELREELKKIALGTTLYQRDYKLTCTVSPEGEHVRLAMMKEVEVINPTLQKEFYKAGWRFTEADRPRDCLVTQIIDDENIRMLELEPVVDSPGYQSSLVEVLIEPRNKNKRYRFISECSIVQPENWYHPMYFGPPTIDVTFTVHAPEGWEVWIGGDMQDRTNVVRFHDKGIKMTGDKLEIHWRGPLGRNLEGRQPIAS